MGSDDAPYSSWWADLVSCGALRLAPSPEERLRVIDWMRCVGRRVGTGLNACMCLGSARSERRASAVLCYGVVHVSGLAGCQGEKD